MRDIRSLRSMGDSVSIAPLTVLKVDCLATDGFHALNEENGPEATSPDLVRNVPLIVLDADGRELVG
jgi:hypothetical protein